MKKGVLPVMVLVLFVLALTAGPDLWAAPGQEVGRQTVPTRTAAPPPTEPPPPPPPTEPPPPPTKPPSSSDPSDDSGPSGPDIAQLEKTLNAAWDSGDWPRVIDVINQMLAVDRDYDSLVDKLYAAHVSYGRQLLDAGDMEGATAQFDRALEIKPGGQEALAGLQRVSGGQSSASSSVTSGEAVVAASPSQALLPDAGGKDVRFHLGAAMIMVGFFVLVMIRRR